MHEYFSGARLYGDDLSGEELAAWFIDEEEGYANLGAGDSSRYRYSYHALNRFHGFDRLDRQFFGDVLGLGSAYGDEFIPIQENIKNLTILDPSERFQPRCSVRGECIYRKPRTNGDLEFEDAAFDLIVCLGVLHHVPNVSHVMAECFRCLRPGAIMLVREPIVTMGDWRFPRPGLTKRERGIPLRLMKEIAAQTGFRTERFSLCAFSPLVKLVQKLRIAPFNSWSVVRIDALISNMLAFHVKYHRTRIIDKFAPASAFFLFRKPEALK